MLRRLKNSRSDLHSLWRRRIKLLSKKKVQYEESLKVIDEELINAYNEIIKHSELPEQ